MFGFDPLSRDERAEADALHDYLDELNAGVLAPRGEIDPDLAATAAQVNTSGRRPAAPYGLRTQIWEDLMSTTPNTAAAPGSITAPHRRHGQADGPLARITQPLRRASRMFPAINFYTAAAIIAVAVMLGGLGAYSFRGGSSNPGTGNPGTGGSMPAVIAQATPDPAYAKDVTQNCFNNPAPDLKTVFDIVNSAVFQTPYTTDENPNATEPVRKPSFVGDLPAPIPAGTDVDATTQQAVIDAYLGFRLCSAKGFDLQVLSVFTPNGIARLLVPGGDRIDFGMITTFLNPYADSQRGYYYPDVTQLTNEIQSVQKLDDGRVVLALTPTDPNAAFSNYNYFVFAQVGDQWMIDDLAWSPVG